MVIMLLAGYLAPAVLALGAVGLLMAGHSLGLLWLLVILLGLMLLQIRNFFGFVVIVGSAVGAAADQLVRPGGPPVRAGVRHHLAAAVLGPEAGAGADRSRRGGRARHTDADQLARLTRVPAQLWSVLFLILNCAGLAVGTALLLPALVDSCALDAICWPSLPKLRRSARVMGFDRSALGQRCRRCAGPP